MDDNTETFAALLRRAAMDILGDMPRDIQEALFEAAMKGREGDREELARLLHDRGQAWRTELGGRWRPSGRHLPNGLDDLVRMVGLGRGRYLSSNRR